LMDMDSLLIKGALSQNDGMFLFEKLNQGNYIIQVRNVEFQTYSSSPITVGQNEEVILDDINLKTKVTSLDEVVVIGEKAMVEVHPDKVVFNVSSSINASGNNALELLNKAPGVIVDLDRNILLQGKSGVQIYINGRPSRISGSDLANMLEGMRSDNIESIEIISNPSAKYDAEGTGGILNIVLKKNLESGFNGNLNGSYSRGVYNRASTGTSLNYSGQKINLFSSFNLSDIDDQDDLDQITLREDFILDMVSNSLSSRKGLNFSGGVDYSINSKHTISLDARVLINDRNVVTESNTLISDMEDILSPELLVSGAFEKGPSRNYNSNVHYSFVPGKSSSLSADLSLGTYSRSTNTRQPNEYFNDSRTVSLRSIEKEYNTSTDISLWSAKLDYEKKISKFSFATGAKYSYIHTYNQLAFYNFENEAPVLDTSKSNEFSYMENIAAAYFIISSKPTEKISLNAGIRLENTSSLGELITTIPGDDNIVSRNYTSLFPNLSVSYDDQKNHAISISIGRRITRPNYQDLNPFEERLSEILLRKGNPFLEPQYINNYQLTYLFRRKLFISNTYSITHGYYARMFEVTGDKSSVFIPRNMQRVTDYGLSVNYPLRVFKWWEFSSTFNYHYRMYDGDMEGTVINLQVNTFDFRMQNNFKLPFGISMELMYTARSPWVFRGSVIIQGSQLVNIGFKREFINKRLLVQLSGNDIFRTRCDYFYESDYGGMKVEGVRTFDNRRIGFSATYKFGNQQAIVGKRKKSAIDEELSRIAD